MWAVWWNSCDGVVCILALWKLCGFCGIACGLPVDFQWPVDISLRMGVLEALDGNVVGCGLAPPFRPSFRWDP